MLYQKVQIAEDVVLFHEKKKYITSRPKKDYALCVCGCVCVRGPAFVH